MGKRLNLTSEIEKQIRTSVGDENLDVRNFAVFEARALSTEPITKYGLYSGARVHQGTLKQMADFINTPGKAIALQIMHENEMLPVGRVFQGKVQMMDNGGVELRALFYLPADKANLIADIENSVIDEVSVGLLTNHAFCSECNFDFFGEKSGLMNVMTATCDNEHTMGQGGAHLNLVDMKDWAELSLVNRGAAKDAKILSRAKQAMGQDTVNRLAASGQPIDARLLTVRHKLDANASSNINKGDLSMTDNANVLAILEAKATEVATAKVELAQATKNVEALTAKNTELSAQLTAKDAEIATLKAASPDLTALTARATEAETKLSAAAEKLLPHAKAALVASGVAEADLPKDVASMIDVIEKKGLKLHQVFAAGASTDASKTDVTDIKDDVSFRSQAFKTFKK